MMWVPYETTAALSVFAGLPCTFVLLIFMFENRCPMPSVHGTTVACKQGDTNPLTTLHAILHILTLGTIHHTCCKRGLSQVGR